MGLHRINHACWLLLALTVGHFIYWGLSYTGHNYTFLFILAALFGVFMAFNIGGNDVANSFGTSVGAGTLTVPQALAIAAVFEVSGAILAGSEVTATIRRGLVDFSVINGIQPVQFILVMMSALLSAALWLLFVTKRGMPVSTTHSIIGGIVGSALCLGFIVKADASALSLVHWNTLGKVVLSWIISPLLGGILSYFLFRQIKWLILDYNDRVDGELKQLKQERRQHKEQHRLSFDQLSEAQKVQVASAMARDAQLHADRDLAAGPITWESDYYRGLEDIQARKRQINPYRALQQWVPIFAALAGMSVSALLIFKGAKQALNLGFLQGMLIVGMVGAFFWVSSFVYVQSLHRKKNIIRSTLLIFGWMQVFTAASFAFSHGANDIANAIGPFAAIMDVMRTNHVNATAPIPPIVTVTFAIALVMGLWFIGREVIRTVGSSLVNIHPASGFAAELSASLVILLASSIGLPVSSTHILVGAVLGIGMVNRDANWALMRPIAATWVITLPVSAGLSAVLFLLLQIIS